MRFVIQRVTYAQCTVDEQITGSIDKGFCVLIGISQTDDEAVADKMVRKLLGMRIFEDSAGKTNLSLSDVNGSLLLISQFTLYLANHLYEYIIDQCKASVDNVQTGIFGADMQISLTNSGPFTIVLDSEDLA